MSQTTTGWLVFIAALGMMCGLLAVDLANLKTWSEATTPSFVGSCMGHVGTIIAAFVGGKMIPAAREAIVPALILPADTAVKGPPV
jgi:glycerol-3-phosphate acyltransferase PlsY